MEIPVPVLDILLLYQWIQNILPDNLLYKKCFVTIADFFMGMINCSIVLATLFVDNNLSSHFLRIWS